MKRIYIFFLFLLPLYAAAQTPLYGDRLFISVDKQDTLKLQYKPDGIYLTGDKPIKIAPYTEQWEEDSIKYGSKSYIKKAIHDSIATISTRVPELSIRMANDTTVYEMTTTNNPYTLNIAYTIRRPHGCTPITSIKVNNANYSVPAINEDQTITGNLSISFPGPGTPAGILYYQKNFLVAVAASKDTVKQSITLSQAWKAYIVAFDYQPVNPLNPSSYLSSITTKLLQNGQCEFINFDPNGFQLIMALPSGYDANQKVINGITTNIFKEAEQTYINIINSRNATHQYKAFYTSFPYLQPIQKIEIR